MCYGVDIDTEVLLKCAIDHHLVMYYDEGCSEPESDEDGGFGTAPFGDADIGGMGLSGQNDSGETGWRVCWLRCAQWARRRFARRCWVSRAECELLFCEVLWSSIENHNVLVTRELLQLQC